MATNHNKPSVAVIGGGIGGLTVANALLNKQVVSRVTVYEQAPYFIPTAGAGFGFSPNGQICLASIGIPPDDQQRLLHPFTTIARTNYEGNQINAQSDVFDGIRTKFGFSIAGCLRADLVDLLVKTLHDNHEKHIEQKRGQSTSPIMYDHKLTSVVQTTSDSNINGKVELQFENGHTDVVDMVIGADGINSTVSRLGIDAEDTPTPPIYSGANIFYGVIPNPDELPFPNEEDGSGRSNPVIDLIRQDHTVIQYPGPGEFLSFRVGPEGRKKLIWACTYVSDGPPDYRHQEWDQARVDHVRDELERKLLRYWPDGHPIHWLTKVTPLPLESSSNMSGSHNDDDNSSNATPGILHFGLYRRPHKSTWYKGRVVLLGDSCHATLPYVGQGANQAIEDAVVLADCLEKQLKEKQTLQELEQLDPNPNATDGRSPIEKMAPSTTMSTDDFKTVFQNYYDQRFERTKRVVNIATVLNTLYHTTFPPARYLMDLLLTSVVRNGIIFKQLEHEIFNECPVKDYDSYRPDRK